MPQKPRSIIAHVEGSGTGARTSSKVCSEPVTMPPIQRDFGATVGCGSLALVWPRVTFQVFPCSRHGDQAWLSTVWANRSHSDGPSRQNQSVLTMGCDVTSGRERGRKCCENNAIKFSIRRWLAKDKFRWDLICRTEGNAAIDA